MEAVICGGERDAREDCCWNACGPLNHCCGLHQNVLCCRNAALSDGDDYEPNSVKLYLCGCFWCCYPCFLVFDSWLSLNLIFCNKLPVEMEPRCCNRRCDCSCAKEHARAVQLQNDAKSSKGAESPVVTAPSNVV